MRVAQCLRRCIVSECCRFEPYRTVGLAQWPTWLRGSWQPLGRNYNTAAQWLTFYDWSCSLESGQKLAVAQPKKSQFRNAYQKIDALCRVFKFLMIKKWRIKLKYYIKPQVFPFSTDMLWQFFKWPLRINYDGYKTSFEKFLLKDDSVTIHQHNLRDIVQSRNGSLTRNICFWLISCSQSFKWELFNKT